MEELEAVDWYKQRVDACKNEELKGILAHNHDEEKEHAAEYHRSMPSPLMFHRSIRCQCYLY